MTVPRFGLPHLSEDAVAAFADGVLAAAAAERARRHCAECVECADAVRGQREMTTMLRSSAAPSLPAGLLDRLSCLPMSAPLPPPRGGLPTVLGADGVPMIVSHRPKREPEDDGRAERTAAEPARHRRVALPMTAFASAVAVVAAGALGGQVSTTASAAETPNPAVNRAANSVQPVRLRIEPALATSTRLAPAVVDLQVRGRLTPAP